MAANLIYTARKLIQAINTKGRKVTFNIKQFVNKDGKLLNLFIVGEAVWDSGREKYNNVELYSSSSAVRIVLYLRDMWYQLNGWDLPQDQEKWNEIREELRAKNNG